MSKPNTYYPDGFCHGGELPDDLWIDRMIYPERQKPVDVEFQSGETFTEYQGRVDEAERKQEHDNYMRDRQFVLTEGNVTGVHTGPPRTVTNEED